MTVLVKTVKLSSKGQLTLPAEAVRALNARKGTEFVLVQDGDRLILTKASVVGKKILDDTAGFETLSLPAFADVWDNPYDEIWNDA